MVIKQIGSEIANARKAKNISVEEIAETTRINADYLRNIEQGNFDFLPKPYVVAYLKIFAGLVGLDGGAFVKRWQDSEIQQEEPEVETTESVVSPMPRQVSQTTAAKQKVAPGAESERPAENKHLREFGIGAGVIAVLAFLFYISNYSAQDTGNQNTNDDLDAGVIPISEMIAENEARIDSIIATIPELNPAPRIERPLTLRLESSDTVWVKLITDGVDTTEYLFLPGRSGTWQANDNFILYSGNAGATHLFLNGVALEPLGALGQVRRLRITRNTIR